jgi:hypothetical protein
MTNAETEKNGYIHYQSIFSFVFPLFDIPLFLQIDFLRNKKRQQNHGSNVNPLSYHLESPSNDLCKVQSVFRVVRIRFWGLFDGFEIVHSLVNFTNSL